MQDAHRSVTVAFRFDGTAYTALSGQSVAAALFASGVKVLRASPRAQQPRGMFCLMGSCQECLVMVDGRRVLACQTPVAAGLSVSVVPQAGAHD
ncbi:MAG TPA: (2Fe-2S)-binding protein [Pseudomonas sp.]|uniref:(2Fe-2S)-binding protein n=1 Tax=Pseudomonas sp. TaxID=306 RepID=UPI002ED8B37A